MSSLHWTFFSSSEQQYWLEQEPQQKSGQNSGIRSSSPAGLHSSPWAEAEKQACSPCPIGQVSSTPQPMTVISPVQHQASFRPPQDQPPPSLYPPLLEATLSALKDALHLLAVPWFPGRKLTFLLVSLMGLLALRIPLKNSRQRINCKGPRQFPFPLQETPFGPVPNLRLHSTFKALFQATSQKLPW